MYFQCIVVLFNKSCFVALFPIRLSKTTVYRIKDVLNFWQVYFCLYKIKAMKTIFFLLVSVLLIPSGLLAQNDEDWCSKKYDVDEFTEIYLEGGYRVHLIQGNENKVLVKAPDKDVFKYLQVKRWSNELRIDVEPDHLEFDRIALYITFKDLEKLHIEGGVKLKTHGYLDLNDFDVYVAGGAKIDLYLKADDVSIVGEGGVLFDLEGVARSLDIRLSGAGHVDADELKAKDVEVEIEGVGTTSVYASETLYAKIEGVGKVRYRGNPEVTKNIDGLGSVTKD